MPYQCQNSNLQEPSEISGVGLDMASCVLSGCFMTTFRKKPFLVISLSLLLVATCACGFSEAQNAMPPLAPAIDRSHSDSSNIMPTGPSASSAPGVAPLQAAASRFDVHLDERHNGAQAGYAPLKGGTTYMTMTVPGEGRSVTVPADVFRKWLEKAHPQFALNSSRIAATDVVEVGGHWDDAGKSLRKLGIPSTKISTGDLRSYPLDHTRVLIINCAGFVNHDCLQRIRDFVVAGGYLLTTDWALDNILQGSFPGYVSYNHKRNRHLSYIAQVTDPDPVLFQNTVTSAHWKCETGCHLMTVLKPQVVRSIVRSQSLAGEDGEGVLAATFPFGRGQVLHLVGHFDNNQGMFRMGDTLPDPAPVIGIALRQAIAANFVVAGVCSVPVPAHQAVR